MIRALLPFFIGDKNARKNGAAPTHIQCRSTPCIVMIAYLLGKVNDFRCFCDDLYASGYALTGQNNGRFS